MKAFQCDGTYFIDEAVLAPVFIMTDHTSWGAENEGRRTLQHCAQQTTHDTGGVIMGTDPKMSAVNRHLQSRDVSNLFVVGASAYPQEAGYNPTDAFGARTNWAADAIKKKYLKKPGPLA